MIIHLFMLPKWKKLKNKNYTRRHHGRTMTQIDEPSVLKLQEELKELENQRFNVESRLRELESKERFEIGRAAGRQIGAAGNRPNKRPREEFDVRGRQDRDRERDRDRDREGRRTNDSEEDYPNKRRFTSSIVPHKVTSAIVKPAATLADSKPTPTLELNNNADIKKRNKKMFGMLLGTLQQFKKDQGQKSDVEQRRLEIEHKVENKVEQERGELLEKHKKILHEQKERELSLADEIRKKQEQTELALLEHKWAKHKTLVANFTHTKAAPFIYYSYGPSAPAGARPPQPEPNLESEKQKEGIKVEMEDTDKGDRRRRRGDEYDEDADDENDRHKEHNGSDDESKHEKDEDAQEKKDSDDKDKMED